MVTLEQVKARAAKRGGKLTRAQVAALRDEYVNGEVSQRKLAKKYNVTLPTIAAALHGKGVYR